MPHRLWYAFWLLRRQTSTTPQTAVHSSTASTKYNGPIAVNATTTIKFFAIDLAGNTEQLQTAAYTIDPTAPQGTLTINGGAASTSSQTVSLNIAGTGIVSIQLSNDGTNYSAKQVLPAMPMSYLLSAGEGVKAVYARLYNAGTPDNPPPAPVAATITLGVKDGLVPGTSNYLASAIFAMQFAKGLVTPSDLDLAHADVAPYRNGHAQPDNKMDLLDVYTILLRQVGIISAF